ARGAAQAQARLRRAARARRAARSHRRARSRAEGARPAPGRPAQLAGGRRCRAGDERALRADRSRAPRGARALGGARVATRLTRVRPAFLEPERAGAPTPRQDDAESPIARTPPGSATIVCAGSRTALRASASISENHCTIDRVYSCWLDALDSAW